jgi:hypothetical protein
MPYRRDALEHEPPEHCVQLAVREIPLSLREQFGGWREQL